MYRMSSSGSAPVPAKMLNDVHHTSQNMLCIFSFIGLIIIIIYNYPQEVKIPGLKTKSKTKMEWLRVGVVLNWKSLAKEDWVEHLNQDRIITRIIIVIIINFYFITFVLLCSQNIFALKFGARFRIYLKIIIW